MIPQIPITNILTLLGSFNGYDVQASSTISTISFANIKYATASGLVWMFPSEKDYSFCCYLFLCDSSTEWTLKS